MPDVLHADSNRWREFRRGAVVAFVLAILFTLVCVQWSYSRGRLSQDATYDDSSYMFEAGRRLAVFYGQGLNAFVATLWNDPPHAPFSDFCAVAAFSVFGLHDWVPYVFVNGPVIFLLLLAVSYLGRAASLRLRVVMMVFALTIPLSVIALHEYRPDSPGALFTALGIFLVGEAALYRVGRWRENQLMVGGVFFGLALLTKSVFFVHTLALESLAIAGACGMTWWIEERSTARIEVLRRWVGIGCRVILPSLLMAAPYFIVNFRNTFGYFYDFALGAHSHVSELKGGLGTSVYFYTLGYAGHLAFGRSFFVGLGLYALCIGLMVRWKQWKELLFQGFLLLVAATSLGAIILNRRENSYFGIPADTLLLFALLRAVFAVWPRFDTASRRGVWALTFLGCLCVVNLSLLEPAWIWPYSTPPLNYLVRRDHSVNQRMLDDIWRELGPRVAINTDSPPLTFVTMGGFVTAPTFRWLALKSGRRLDFVDVWTDENPETLRKNVRDSSFVITAEDGAAGVYQQNAAWEMRRDSDRLVAATPGIRLLARYPTSPGGPAYRLFVNDDKLLSQFGSFGDFQALEGFMPWEGPYPQWHLGRVRWAVAPKTRFALSADSAGDAVLRFSVRADQPVRASLRFHGASVLQIDTPQRPGFQAFSVPVKVQAGENEFVLDYENKLPMAPDGFQRALLFRQLELQVKR